MTELTAREITEDHILVAHTYAKAMGQTGALDAAEAVVNARRPGADPTYAADIRERIAYMFLTAPKQGAGDFFMMARSLESHLWAGLREREKNRQN